MANPQKQLNQAIQLHQAGHFNEAIDLYTKALPRMKNNPKILFLLGSAQLESGQHQSCIDMMKRSLALDPKNPFAYINQGNAFHSLVQLDEAVAAFDRAIALKPVLPEVHNNRGAALLGLGRLEEALASFDRALVLNPDYVEALYNRGNVLKELGRTEEAIASYDKLLAINSRYVEVYINRGVALQRLGRMEEALVSLDRAMALNSDLVEVHNNRGVVLQSLGRMEEALTSFDRALELNPEYSKAYNNKGATLLDLCRAEEALVLFDQALALDSGYVDAHNNRGRVLQDLNRLEEALVSFDRARNLNPDYAEADWNKSLLLILSGRYPEGWELYESRLKTERDKDNHYSFPRLAWRGQEDIRGKRVFVYDEQGLGDAIQFCRYLPQVQALGAEVIFESKKSLAPLISTLNCPMTFVMKGEALPEFDAYCPLMSLPYIFKTTLETIPATVPYLHADEGKAEQWRQRLGDRERLRVGLVWSGSAFHQNDAQRSIRLEMMEPLMDFPAEFHSLQKEYRESDLEFLAQHPEVRQHQHELHDFSDTAALIECLDLVISVDTSVAHVTGAMGKPVWILLPFAPDYRWMVDRDDSPWYPTARLFRQSAIGDWAGAINGVISAMEQTSVSG